MSLVYSRKWKPRVVATEWAGRTVVRHSRMVLPWTFIGLASSPPYSLAPLFPVLPYHVTLFISFTPLVTFYYDNRDYVICIPAAETITDPGWKLNKYLWAAWICTSQCQALWEIEGLQWKIRSKHCCLQGAWNVCGINELQAMWANCAQNWMIYTACAVRSHSTIPLIISLILHLYFSSVSKVLNIYYMPSIYIT